MKQRRWGCGGVFSAFLFLWLAGICSFSEALAQEGGEWLYLKEVRLTDEDGQKTLLFRLSQPPGEVEYFPLRSPTRLVIDVRGPVDAFPRVESYPAVDSLISRVRVQYERGKMRLVLDLKAEEIPVFSVESSDGVIKTFLDEKRNGKGEVESQVLFLAEEEKRALLRLARSQTPRVSAVAVAEADGGVLSQAERDESFEEIPAPAPAALEQTPPVRVVRLAQGSVEELEVPTSALSQADPELSRRVEREDSSEKTPTPAPALLEETPALALSQAEEDKSLEETPAPLEETPVLALSQAEEDKSLEEAPAPPTAPVEEIPAPVLQIAQGSVEEPETPTSALSQARPELSRRVEEKDSSEEVLAPSETPVEEAPASALQLAQVSVEEPETPASASSQVEQEDSPEEVPAPSAAPVEEAPAQVVQPPQASPEKESPAPVLSEVEEPAVEAAGEEVQPPPSALSQAEEEVSGYTGQPISLDFRDTDIRDVLRILADISGINIIATDDVSGRITLRLINVPWDQALDVVLQANGLEKVQVNNVVQVSTAERLSRERTARLEAQQAEENLEPIQTEYIRINYAKAEELTDLIQGVGGEGEGAGILTDRGNVFADEGTNTLIVRDIQAGIDTVREFVRQLDIQTPQVHIETYLVEAQEGAAQDLGIQ